MNLARKRLINCMGLFGIRPSPRLAPGSPEIQYDASFVHGAGGEGASAEGRRGSHADPWRALPRLCQARKQSSSKHAPKSTAVRAPARGDIAGTTRTVPRIFPAARTPTPGSLHARQSPAMDRRWPPSRPGPETQAELLL